MRISKLRIGNACPTSDLQAPRRPLLLPPRRPCWQLRPHPQPAARRGQPRRRLLQAPLRWPALALRQPWQRPAAAVGRRRAGAPGAALWPPRLAPMPLAWRPPWQRRQLQSRRVLQRLRRHTRSGRGHLPAQLQPPPQGQLQAMQAPALRARPPRPVPQRWEQPAPLHSALAQPAQHLPLPPLLLLLHRLLLLARLLARRRRQMQPVLQRQPAAALPRRRPLRLAGPPLLLLLPLLRLLAALTPAVHLRSALEPLQPPALRLQPLQPPAALRLQLLLPQLVEPLHLLLLLQ